MATSIINSTLLIVGYLFTFLIPGMYIVETFFDHLPNRFKLPLYMLLSVMVSTYLVYFVSLLLGFSRYSILVSFSFFIPWIVIHFKRNINIFLKLLSVNIYIVVTAVVVFLIYLIALFPGIFTNHDGFVVMSSSNWQDTAMHSGIIESISQGNFPPQAPYFSGVPLNYYYFTDFHSSILETLYGQFFPRVIVYDNPLFAAIFFLSVYLLSYEVIKNKNASIFSGIGATFFGSLIYTNFLSDLYSSEVKNKFLVGIDLLRNNSYAIEFGKFFQISPMADYFLQNRPMMVGLPAVVIITALAIYIFKNKKYEWMILPGIISAMLLKFQFFAFVVSFFIFGALTIFNFKFKKIKQLLLSVILYLIVPLVFIIIFSGASKINNESIVKVVVDNFKFSPWEEGKPFIWYFRFLLANLGLPLVIFSLSVPILLLFKRVNFQSITKIGSVFFIGTILLFIPLICRFTIMKYDMLKFYYFAEIFLVIVTFWFIFKLIKNKLLRFVVSVIVLLLIIPASFTNLTNSFLNKTMAYSYFEIDAGYWIRDNTPRNSVFMDLANLHSPITEVAGRLRVLSYINWPHSHGYNIGTDNVFTRLDDIRKIYRGEDDYNSILSLLDKYDINYVYLGNEERNEFPDAKENLNNMNFLENVYSNDAVTIFKVIKS